MPDSLPVATHNVRLFTWTQFLHALVFTIPIWIVYYQSKVTVEQISILVAVGYAVQVFSELPTGAFADLFGKRVSISAGLLVGAVAYCLFPFAESFTHFLLLSGLVGFSDSLLSGANEALLYDSLKQDDREAEFPAIMAHIGVLYQIGLIISTILGGMLYQPHTSAPFLFYGVSMLIGSVLALWLKEPLVDSEKFTLRNYARQIKWGAHEAFKNSRTRLISTFYILVGSITWTCALYFNSYMFVDLGFGDAERGYIEGALRLFNILLLSRLLKNERLFTYNRSILFFPLVMVIAMLPGIWLDGWIGVPFVAGGMIASTARWIILGRYTNKAFSSKYRATAISTLSMIIGLIFIIITWGSGAIIAQYGVKTMYTILGIISLLLVTPVAVVLVRQPSTA